MVGLVELLESCKLARIRWQRLIFSFIPFIVLEQYHERVREARRLY